nr:hypothetical protein [Tanacetum cinerariifolium]
MLSATIHRIQQRRYGVSAPAHHKNTLDDLLSNDVQRDIVDRKCAYLTNQHDVTTSPLVTYVLFLLDPAARDEGLTTKDEGLGMRVEIRGLHDEIRGLDDEGHSVGSGGFSLEEEEAVPEGQQRAVLVVGTAVSEPLGLGYGALRHRELALEENHVYSTFEVDPKDGMVNIDVPAYPPPAPPAQTPSSPEWSSGSFPISPTPFIVPSPIPSPMISLTVPSPIASPVATSTATILVDEDQLIEIDSDVRELYNRSGEVRDEIFSQRYQFRSLEHEQERIVVKFGALWRPMLALEAWTGPDRLAVRAARHERTCYYVGAEEGP